MGAFTVAEHGLATVGPIRGFAGQQPKDAATNPRSSTWARICVHLGSAGSNEESMVSDMTETLCVAHATGGDGGPPYSADDAFNRYGVYRQSRMPLGVEVPSLKYRSLPWSASRHTPEVRSAVLALVAGSTWYSCPPLTA